MQGVGPRLFHSLCAEVAPSIGLYKTGVIRKRSPWKTIDDMGLASPEGVYWFDQRRLFETIGHIPLAKLRELYYGKQILAEEAEFRQLILH